MQGIEVEPLIGEKRKGQGRSHGAGSDCGGVTVRGVEEEEEAFSLQWSLGKKKMERGKAQERGKEKKKRDGLEDFSP